MKSLYKMGAALAAAALCSPVGAWACAACSGQSDSTMAKSLNAGIFSLMAVVVMVLGGAASFFVFLARRSAVETQPSAAPRSETQ